MTRKTGEKEEIIEFIKNNRPQSNKDTIFSEDFDWDQPTADAVEEAFNLLIIGIKGLTNDQKDGWRTK